jgi:hypothetical protein
MTRSPQTNPITAGSGEEIVEQVARAIHAAMLDMEAGEGGCQWDELTEEQRAMLDCLARAAIEAQQATIRGLVEALKEARAVIKLDADACRAFAGEGEPVELEQVLSIIDHALSIVRVGYDRRS